MALYKTTDSSGTGLTPSADDKKKPNRLQTISTSYQSPSRENTGRIQMLNNQIYAVDENGVIRGVFGYSNGKWVIETSQDGYDITNCTDDQKSFSSNFNMYKIISSGDLTLGARNSTISLTSTNIGYQYMIIIDNVIPDGYQFDGDLFVRVTGKYNSTLYADMMDIKSSGNFYNDGTNKAEYNYHYHVNAGENKLYIIFNVRQTAGTVSFNPSTVFAGRLHWEICNHTKQSAYGGGGTETGDGKYYYYDIVTYDTDGNITTALVSTLEQFYNNESSHFPKPKLNVPGFIRW